MHSLRSLARPWGLSLLALCTQTGCNERPAPMRAAPALSAPDGAPRLVVSVVLDQVGSWVLARYLSKLHPQGAIRRAIAHGMHYERVRYAYAGTYTAPGHAAIYTGQSPSRSGVAMNRAWSPEHPHTISIVEDGTHAVHGAREATASPVLLQCETVADVLLRVNHGLSRVVSLSMKDRGAVIPGGQRPTAAVWYDEHAQRFTTSSYYERQVPAWLTAFGQERPLSSWLAPWTPLNPSEFAGRTQSDPAPGEGDWKGLGTTFPHDIAHSREPQATMLATPRSTEWLLDLSARAARTYDLGHDSQPDLLAISISGTDYVGHVFGPESLEAEDNLVRVDLALARLLDTFEREHRGPIALVITADHGVAKLPESSQHEGLDAHRIDWDTLPNQMDAAITLALGATVPPRSSPDAGPPDAGPHAGAQPRRWIAAFAQPFLFLTDEAKQPGVRDRVVQAAIAAARTMPGVYAGFDTREAPRMRVSAEPIERAVGLSIPDRAAYWLGDVYIVPAQRSIVDERMPRGHGTSHGSPWAYDTEVPVIVSGPGVPHGAHAEVLEQSHVAATIAALLGVPAPRGAPQEPLPGVSGAGHAR